jgi:5-hydroxyisourate hydrolase
MAAPSEKPPITCHVLDTIAGKPGKNIAVQLKLLQLLGQEQTKPPTFSATTDDDGRVKAWSGQDGASLSEIFDIARSKADKPMVWSIRFDSGSYFDIDKTFFPYIEITFSVSSTEEHYHVPLLLGPWSYTTYRGS